MFYESIHDFLFNVMSQFYMTGVIEAAQDYILRDEGYKNSVVSSDGSGPKKSSPGRAQALNVKLGPGPGLSPSLKAGPRAGRACRAQSFTN